MNELMIQDSPDMERRQQLANMLMQTGQQRGPVQHWTQGLNRILGSGIGAYKDKKLSQEREQNQQNFNQEISGANGNMEQLASVLANSGNTELAMTIMAQQANQKRAEEQRQADIQRQLEAEQRQVARENEMFAKKNAEYDRRQGSQQSSGGISPALKEKMMFEDYKAQMKQQAQQQELEQQQATADKETLGALAQGADVITNEDFSAGVGPVDRFTSKIGNLFGSDDSRANKAADMYIANQVLDASGKLKGAISEAEWPRLERTAPSTSDHPKVWVDWYMDVLDAAERSNPNLSGEIGEFRKNVLTSADQQFGYTPQKKSPQAGTSNDSDPLGLGF